ncbi:BLUF domain-containing protein [Cognatilysobacter tabacisoli]|uniref:BLUF domain-containing protein n=1 Tax=Cognatilysobacter tabacisoli TaxID=2315424 RepID=UPI000E6B47E8|nr:BLUF domain-containing protein [Lysobacter tabacisoli]
MSDLVQIVYISRSTFKPLPPELGIEPSVTRILAQSRLNNARRGLVGALYFGDGCFFQCLEGAANQVDALYSRLLDDPRHTDLQVLSRKPIEQRSFATWSMKYVPLDADIKALLASRGLDRFDPYRFGRAEVERVMELLKTGTAADEGPAPVAPADYPALPAAREAAPASTHDPVARRTAALALALAAIALAASGLALLR